MDPYVQFTLAMCLVVGLSLAGTAWLAASFNRRAKADLRERLEPLAVTIGGTVDVEEATVSGRCAGQLAFGRVATAQGGFGRLFHVELVDAAGGARWEWSNLPEKGRPEPRRVFEGDPALRERLGLDVEALAATVPDAARQRWGVLYDPEAGMVRLTREMRSRLDLPTAEQFRAQLAALAAIGAANRRAQGAPDADAPPRLAAPETDRPPSAADGGLPAIDHARGVHGAAPAVAAPDRSKVGSAAPSSERANPAPGVEAGAPPAAREAGAGAAPPADGAG